MQSRVRCTIFVNIIDFVVSAVVERVYSSTFKFCLLKIQEICPQKRFILPQNAPKCIWWQGSARTCWGELTVLPQTS